MKIIDAEQRSPDWFAAKAGVPSASGFHNILTPTGKPTTGAKAVNYRNTLLAEWLVGGEIESYTNQWMQRGVEMEAEARESFEFITDMTVDEVGFCKSEAPVCGCSPDGLIGGGEGLEIKCPAPYTHVQYLLDGRVPNEYIPQIQGSMLVTGRDLWWFMSYHPGMDPLIIGVSRDDDYIGALAEALGKFNRELSECKQKLINKGYTPISEAA